MKKALIIISIILFYGCGNHQDYSDINNSYRRRTIVLLNYQGDTIEKFQSNKIHRYAGSYLIFEDSSCKKIVLSGGIIIAKEQ